MTGGIVYVVDDDAAVLQATARLLRVMGFTTRCFADAAAFLAAHDRDEPGCLLLDLGLPDIDGLQVQQLLALDAGQRPVVFMSGSTDVASAVSAMKGGALDFLLKPVPAERLAQVLGQALERDGQRRAVALRRRDAEQRLASLTPRERQVLDQVLRGLLNKQIADVLGTTEKTIKVHRARAMQKLRVRSMLQLERLALELGIEPVLAPGPIDAPPSRA